MGAPKGNRNNPKGTASNLVPGGGSFPTWRGPTKEQWEDFKSDLLQGASITKASKRFGICSTTFRRWRERCFWFDAEVNGLLEVRRREIRRARAEIRKAVRG